MPLTRTAFRTLTVEHGILICLFLLALALRLVRLDAVPVPAAEASRALAAWQLLQGGVPEWWQAPLLPSLGAFVFFLLGDGDAAARLPSALAGAALVPALWLYRRWLGGAAVAGAAALVALSPVGIAVSRSVSEAAPAALATVLGGWALLRLAEEPRPRLIGLSAAGFAALLHLGYPGVTGLMALALFVLAWYAFRSAEAPPPLPRLRAWRPAVVPFLGAFLLFGTGWFLFPQGFGLPGVQAWAAHFDPAGPAFPWYYPWFLLAGYELVAMLAGGVAAYGAIRGLVAGLAEPRRAAHALFALWGVIGLVFLLLGGRPDAAALFAPAFPLTVLAGCWLGSGLAQADRASLARAGLLLVSAGVAAVFGLLNVLALLQEGGQGSSGTLPGATAGLVLAAMVLGLGVWYSPRPRAAGAVLVAVAAILLAGHSSALLGLGAARPAEAATQGEAIAAVAGLARLAPYTEKGRGELILVESDLRQPLGWYLRDALQVSYLAQAQAGPTHVIAREGAAGGLTGYLGRTVTLTEGWRAGGWAWQETWRWLFTGIRPAESREALRMTVWSRT